MIKEAVNMKKNTQKHQYYPSNIISVTPFSIKNISYRKQSKEKHKATIDILKTFNFFEIMTFSNISLH